MSHTLSCTEDVQPFDIDPEEVLGLKKTQITKLPQTGYFQTLSLL